MLIVVKLLLLKYHSTQNISIQHAFACQAANADRNPSAFQMEFAVVMQRLLSLVHPKLHYHVISETKECNEYGNRNNLTFS